MRRRFLLACCLTTAFVAAACGESPSTTPELQAILHSKAPPRGVSSAVWSDVQKFYAGREQKLAWLLADAATTESTYAALDTLRAAEAHGLDPSTYGEPALRERAKALETTSDSAERATEIADVDVRLTAALLQLGRHVATGRVAPGVIDKRWNSSRQPPDYVAALATAASADVRAFLDAVQPKHPEYQALRGALDSLRAQSGKDWPKVPRARVKLGQWNATVVIPLRQRLSIAGYLTASASLDSAQYDPDVEAAVKAFQEQHRLAATGVLDRITVDKLNVPIETRLAQVAINLERWRWLPDDLGARHFLVNVPFFDLVAREQGRPVLDMRVVVGKRGNETPLFSDQMETVVFSPYWNVPETIAMEETLPAVERDPDFLSRNNMEIVDAGGNVVAPEDVPWGDEAAMDNLRFRQRPGANNALGHVKFLFPNEHAVYLHDTPADDLFKRIGRAFSHGCVRVEEPERLAEYVLRDQQEWTADTIQTAMRADEPRHVKLGAPIPVHIIYMTVRVAEAGHIQFADDVYGYDARQMQQMR